jgi:hypothetical protein
MKDMHAVKAPHTAHRFLGQLAVADGLAPRDEITINGVAYPGETYRRLQEALEARLFVDGVVLLDSGPGDL